jgi:hypothetical protein
MGQRAGGCDDAVNCVPQVMQMKFIRERDDPARRWDSGDA